MIESGAKLAAEAKRLAAEFRRSGEAHQGDEAGFRSEAEAELARAAEALGSPGLDRDKRLEVTLATGRADAVFNRLVVEWEPPGRMSAKRTHPGNKHAVGQVRDYMNGLAEKERREVSRLAGVACDGRFMIFARYKAGRWVVDEPVSVDARSAAQLLESLLASQSGRALTAENLIHDFSGEGHIARNLTRALLDQLDAELGQRPSGLPARLYEQWERFFAVATGVTGEAEGLKADARKALAELLDMKPGDVHPGRALFSIQTYFAIVTKLIATLSLSLFMDRAKWSLDELASGGEEALLEDMARLHRGAPFTEIGLSNVIEPDVFAWFLERWRKPVASGVREVADRLKVYDPATLEVSPEEARDLLKDLYQGLLPRPVRHALGQYFTPDWLAEQLLERVGYDGDPEKRVLDPACGTGTFLVAAIGRLKEHLRAQDVSDGEALRRVLGSVAGFDIDPLAVVAARANYVLALGPLVGAAGKAGLDLPVYLADSIVGPELKELAVGDRYVLETAAGRFELPARVDTAEELRDVTDLAAAGLEKAWSGSEFAKRAGKACAATSAERDVLAGFFAKCSELHTDEVDGIWTRVLRNAFMPAFLEPFDHIVGNPPWVNWETLPESYRERTNPLWREAGLFVHKGMAAMLGAGKKDVAMLMSYVVSRRLLKERGTLGFVITETVFKTAGAGQGFRRFSYGDSGPSFKVEQVEDLVDLNPFTGATNRTALFVWRRDAKTRYPVRYTVWQRRERRGIDRHATADEVDALTRPLRLVASPVREDDPTSAWLTAPKDLVQSLRRIAETGDAEYEAREGVNSGGANGVYWLDAKAKPDKAGMVAVENLHDVGKSVLPKKYGSVEQGLIHPLVRGQDVQRWTAEPSAHILFVQDPATRRGIEEARMRSDFPGALKYLSEFEQHLRKRAAFKRFYTRVDASGTRIETGRYWSMFNVGGYTLAKHKVVWKDIATDFAAAVIPAGDPCALPAHTVMLIPCGTRDEAHFICGLLNSTPSRALVSAYVATHISTHTTKVIHVPRFEQGKPAHTAAAKASRAAHAAVKAGEQPDQEAVDAAAGKIWGLSKKQVGELRKFLDQLLKRDLAGE
ncbi:MAG: N-6 DNA methylase [Solirubrobacterales bacterium]